jgi:hypothetical protein
MGCGPWRMDGRWAKYALARCPPEMPSLGGRKVRSPLFALDVRRRDPAAVLREAEDGAVRIVGRYVPKTEAQRSWDIRGSNDRLNRVFELNCLPYGGYPGEDVIDRRGKKPAVVTEDDPAPKAAPSTKKRKLGTAVGELGVSDSFAMELMGTCAAPGGRMSSPELRESSARMLEVTGGRWPKHVPIPRAAGEDFFTSRMARDLRVFSYGRNIAAVVSAVMNKDRQDAAQKRRAIIRLPEARPKRARGTAKAIVPGGSQPTLAVKPAAPGSSKVPSLPRTELRRSGNCLHRGNALPTSTQILAWTTISLVSIFLTGDMLQGRARGNLLLSRLRWQPRRLPRCLGRRVALSALAARFWRLLPSRTKRALCPAG